MKSTIPNEPQRNQPGMSRLARKLELLKEFHPIVHTLLIGTVLARAASSMSMPFLAIYLGTQTDASKLLIGFIIGAGSLAGTLGGFFGGTLSDRLGRKVIMMSALFVWGAVFLGFGFAKTPLLFFGLNILNGLCRTFFEPVSQALMADLTPKEKRFQVFNLRYLAINIGVVVGPLAGVYFASLGSSLPFLLTGLVYLLYAGILSYFLARFGIRKIEGEKKSDVTFRSAWNVIRKDIPFRYYLIGGMIGAMSYSQINVNLSQYLNESFVDGVRMFSVLISINAATVVLFQLPLMAWAGKRSSLTAVIVGSVLFSLGNVGFAFSIGWTTFILAMVVFTLGEILTFPSTNLLIDQVAPEGMRGTYYGAQTFTNLGHFLGPTIGGYLLTAANGRMLFLSMGILVLTTAFFYRRGYALAELQHQSDSDGKQIG